MGERFKSLLSYCSLRQSYQLCRTLLACLQCRSCLLESRLITHKQFVRLMHPSPDALRGICTAQAHSRLPTFFNLPSILAACASKAFTHSQTVRFMREATAHARLPAFFNRFSFLAACASKTCFSIRNSSIAPFPPHISSFPDF